MTDARTIAELRYDAMPPAVIARLKHGSATAAEIIRCEDSIAFYRDQIIRTRTSAKAWFQRGSLDMVRQNMADSRLYLREWRRDRARLKDLRGNDAALKGATRVLGLISQVMDEKEQE